MLEALGTVRTGEISTSMNLLVPQEVVLGVKHLPADVTGVATLLMSPLLVFTKTFVPVCFNELVTTLTFNNSMGLKMSLELSLGFTDYVTNPAGQLSSWPIIITHVT